LKRGINLTDMEEHSVQVMWSFRQQVAKTNKSISAYSSKWPERHWHKFKKNKTNKQTP